jgi:ribosomal-protein-alanine N-acetyltransferase
LRRAKLPIKQSEYRTRRLIIRPLRKTDYNAWLDAYTNGHARKTRWDLDPKPVSECTRTYFKKLVLRLNEFAKKDDYYRYSVFEKKSGLLLGHIDFDIYVRSTHQFANFGYQIFNRHWQRGYGQESAKIGLKIGFKELRLNRLEAAINLDNRKSIRLVKAIGMKREGIKKRYWFEDNKWVDHIIYVANPEDVNLKSKKPF